MKIRLQKGTTLTHDKKDYGPGDEVDMPDKLADALIRTGSAVPVDGGKAKK